MEHASGASFVEVGVWQGRSTAFMAVEVINSGKDLTLYVVDHFQGSDEVAHKRNHYVKTNTLFMKFMDNMEPVFDWEDANERIILNIHKGDSVDMALRIMDDELFFVMIDGDHTYNGVKRDINAYWPKLVSGGYMCFDDIAWAGVDEAVRELSQDKGLEVHMAGEGKHRYAWVKKP